MKVRDWTSNLSRPIGGAIASVAVLLGQLMMHLWAYGGDAERYFPLRFFAGPLTVSMVALAISGTWLTANVLFRRKRGEDEQVALSTRTALLSSVFGAVVVNAAAIASFIEFDIYWSVMAFAFGVPALLASIAIAALLVLVVLPVASRALRPRKAMPATPEELELRERLGR